MTHVLQTERQPDESYQRRHKYLPVSSLRLLLPHMARHGRQNKANRFSTKIPAVAEETKCSQQEAPHPSIFGSSGLIF